MSAPLPDRASAHLLIAALRILRARDGRPPAPEEIAKLLGWYADKTQLLCRGLEGTGIVVPIESPYDVRYDLGDHLKLESLPAEASDAGMAEELADFEKRAEERATALEELFGGGADEEQRKKLEKLDSDFGDFRSKKPTDPFA